MADSSLFSIKKLNGDNYTSWCYKVKWILKTKGVWSAVDKAKPAACTTTSTEATAIAAAEKANDEWLKKDEDAHGIIALSVEDSQQRFIKNKTTAREAWLALESYYQKSTTSNKVHLLKRLCRTFLEEGGDMEDHIVTLSDCFDKLTALEVNFDDTVVACLYLSSLPESYDTLVTALESRPETDLTSEFVKGRLIDEFRKRKGAKEIRESISKETAMKAEHKANSSGSQGSKCYFCKKKGHIKPNCHKYKAWKAKQEKEEEKSNKVSEDSGKKGDYAYLARASLNTCSEVCLGAKTTDCSWIVDSGATSHMVQSPDFFSKIDSSKKGFVSLADERKAQIAGKGSGAIKCSIGKEKISDLEINDVLLVPGLGTNLLSVRKMTNEGYELIFKGDSCRVVKDGVVKAVARAPLHSDLYEIKTAEKACTANIAIKVESSEGHSENCLHVWHRRFGHRHWDAIKELSSRGLATGIQVNDCGRREICECCYKGKKCRAWHFQRNRLATQQPHSS